MRCLQMFIGVGVWRSLECFQMFIVLGTEWDICRCSPAISAKAVSMSKGLEAFKVR